MAEGWVGGRPRPSRVSRGSNPLSPRTRRRGSVPSVSVSPPKGTPYVLYKSVKVNRT